MKRNRSIFLWISISFFVITLYLIIAQNLQQNPNLPGFTLFNTQEQIQQPEYSIKTPEEIVRQYFESWDKEDWPNMYATLSDGFKKIDPNAKDLSTFRSFASSQGIEGVTIINIQEESNDGTTAIVSYSIEFALSNGNKQSFTDKFTLKFRQGDTIQGWKLIHPYGENIDTS